MFLILFVLTAVSLFLCLLFTPLVRALALRWNLVDAPDHKRKVHQKPIPRVGGVALFAAYFGSFLATMAIFSQWHLGPQLDLAAMKSIARPTVLVFLIGIADDIFGLKPWHKFMVELVAGLLVVSSGIHMGDFPLFIAHPLLGVIATVVWLVGCTNAVNLIDGLDGLAAGIALLATMTTLIASIVSGHVELTIATAPLAGVLIGFLVFNFNPASIFLGDSGSLVLGFLLGCYSLLWSAKSATILGMTAPFMALSVPLLDTTLAIVRRFLRGQPIFRPDRSHVHHRLLARGLTHRRAVIFLYLAGGVAGLLSLCLIWIHSHGEAVVLLAFVGGALYGIQRLDYAEFNAARRVLLRRGLRREIHAQLAVETFEHSLVAAVTPHGCWDVVQRASKECGLEVTRMRFSGHLFGEAVQGSAHPSTINFAISRTDWIELSLSAGPDGCPSALVPFALVTRRILAGKRFEGTFSHQLETDYSSMLYQTIPSTVK
jgi:UDP-GlcNAc:undecaprenyl-phosphate GlcNAc-1-phosphate transferase